MNVIRSGLSLLGRLSGQRSASSLAPLLSNTSGLFSGHTLDRPLAQLDYQKTLLTSSPLLERSFSSLGHQHEPLFQTSQILPFVNLGGIRTVISHSFQSGRRKNVGAVTDRFFRLHWGIWIRTKAGRHRRIWRKNDNMRKAARQHVFCSSTQSRMLDKMVSKFWLKKTYYVDDPYESYHNRDNYPKTRKLYPF